MAETLPFRREPGHRVPIRPDLMLYAKLAQRGTGLVAGQIEVTSQCFQQCRMCESWRDDLSGVQRGLFSLDGLKDICQQLAAMPTFEHLALTGGDPQRWPHLSEFLKWWVDAKLPFALQINTALTRDDDWDLWRRAFRDVRVSLDAVSPEKYLKIRGDKETKPDDVLRRIAQLHHPRLQTNTCVVPLNVDEIPRILLALAQLGLQCEPVWDYANGPLVRKASFLPVIGPREARTGVFWARFDEEAAAATVRARGLPFELSFAEAVPDVRAFLTGDVGHIPCFVGNITFHIKANGDYYPCCLTGGEAIATYAPFKLGNVCEAPLLELAKRWQSRKVYKDGSPCPDICQWKQLNMNLAAFHAEGVTLAMP